tara:strand:+ start:201 stop:485 length:285 start_codon:yes stop_codon:yes gene_type:complete
MEKEMTELLVNVQEKSRTLSKELEQARSLLSFVKDSMKTNSEYRKTISFKLLNDYFKKLKEEKNTIIKQQGDKARFIGGHKDYIKNVNKVVNNF